MGQMNVIVNLKIHKSTTPHRASRNVKHKKDDKSRKDKEKDL
jgi:hypothetical protein